MGNKLTSHTHILFTDAVLPCSIAGMQFSWTGVGLLIPSCLHCLINQSERPSDAKSAISSVACSQKQERSFCEQYFTQLPLNHTGAKHPRGFTQLSRNDDVLWRSLLFPVKAEADNRILLFFICLVSTSSLPLLSTHEIKSRQYNSFV